MEREHFNYMDMTSGHIRSGGGPSTCRRAYSDGGVRGRPLSGIGDPPRRTPLQPLQGPIAGPTASPLPQNFTKNSADTLQAQICCGRSGRTTTRRCHSAYSFSRKQNCTESRSNRFCPLFCRRHSGRAGMSKPERTPHPVLLRAGSHS